MKDSVINSMQNKFCVVTGATSGIGRAAAIGLGQAGANIIAIGQNQSRGKKVVDYINALPGEGTAKFMACDLSSQRQVRDLSARIKNEESCLDVLVTCAGANYDRFLLSEDNIEMTFASSYLSHFLLTALLIGPLKESQDARIVNISGESHRGVSADFEKCMKMEGFERRQAKKRISLARLMYTYELSGRLKNTNITVNAVHPGGVASRLGMNNGLISWSRHIVSHILHKNLISPKKGADTAIYLATSPDMKGKSGRYYYLREPMESSYESMDKEAWQSLWDLSLKMTSMDESIGDGWQYFKPL